MTNVVKQRQLKTVPNRVLEVLNGTLTTDIGYGGGLTTLQDGNVFVVNESASRFMVLNPDGTEVSNGNLNTDIGFVYALTTLQDGNVFMVNEASTQFMILRPGGTKVSSGNLPVDLGQVYDITTLLDGNIFVIGENSDYMILNPDGTLISNGTSYYVAGARNITTLQNGNVFIIGGGGKFIILKSDGTGVTSGTLRTSIGTIDGILTLQNGNIFIVNTAASRYLVLNPDGTEIYNGYLYTDINETYDITLLNDGNIFFISGDAAKFSVLKQEDERKVKITPKSDFIYNSSEDIYLIDLEGNNKSDTVAATTSADNYHYTSVGKGQFMTVAPSLTDGAQLKLWTKDTGVGVSVLNLGLNNGTDVWTDIDKYKPFTFLGQCFKDQGDNDRYVVVVQASETSDKKKYPSLFNIDKWEYVNPRTSVGYVNYFDILYDGRDTLYICYNGERIQTGSLLQWYTERTTLGELFDNNGNQVKAAGIYGVTTSTTIDSGRLLYKTLDDKVKVILLNDSTLGNSHVLGTNGTVVVCPAADTIFDFDQSQSHIVSKEDGTFLMRRSNSIVVQLLTDTNEKAVKVINFNHIPNVSTIMDVVLSDTTTNDLVIRRFTVDWSAGYNLGVASNVLLGSVSTSSTTFISENNIVDSCNTYGVGKFFDYGLQRKWDDRYAQV